MNAAWRLQAALTEIARRRVVAEHALTTIDDQLQPIHPPTPWHEEHEVWRRMLTSRARAAFIAENSPAHVLAVLELHETFLRQVDEWMLARLDRPAVFTTLLKGLLDLYAPASAEAEVPA